MKRYKLKSVILLKTFVAYNASFLNVSLIIAHKVKEGYSKLVEILAQPGFEESRECKSVS